MFLSGSTQFVASENRVTVPLIPSRMLPLYVAKKNGLSFNHGANEMVSPDELIFVAVLSCWMDR